MLLSASDVSAMLPRPTNIGWMVSKGPSKFASEFSEMVTGADSLAVFENRRRITMDAAGTSEN